MASNRVVVFFQLSVLSVAADILQWQPTALVIGQPLHRAAVTMAVTLIRDRQSLCDFLLMARCVLLDLTISEKMMFW